MDNVPQPSGNGEAPGQGLPEPGSELRPSPDVWSEQILEPVRGMLRTFSDALELLSRENDAVEMLEAYANALQGVDSGISIRGRFDPKLARVAAEALCETWKWRHVPDGINTIEGSSLILRHNRDNTKTPVSVTLKELPLESPSTGRGPNEGIWTLEELVSYAENQKILRRRRT